MRLLCYDRLLCQLGEGETKLRERKRGKNTYCSTAPEKNGWVREGYSSEDCISLSNIRDLFNHERNSDRMKLAHHSFKTRQVKSGELLDRDRFQLGHLCLRQFDPYLKTALIHLKCVIIPRRNQTGALKAPSPLFAPVPFHISLFPRHFTASVRIYSSL